MSYRRRSIQSYRRSTFWHLWWPYKWFNVSQEDPSTWLLLAKYGRRLRQVCPSLWEVSTLRRQNSCTRFFSPSTVLTVAILYMDIWYGWTTVWNRNWSSKAQILHLDSNWVLHQIGRSWNLRQNQSINSGQVHQDQHHRKVQHSQSNCHRQRTIICLLRTQRYVRQVWNSITPFFAILSTRKRTSWSYQ